MTNPIHSGMPCDPLEVEGWEVVHKPGCDRLHDGVCWQTLRERRRISGTVGALAILAAVVLVLLALAVSR